MISLELARKLKEAGLPWNVALYDLCYYQERLYSVIFAFADKVIISPGVRVDISECVFCPRLDQLLAEIERRGWHVAIQKLEYYEAFLYEDQQEEGSWLVWNNQAGPASSWEEAAAEALIWIFEREKEAGYKAAAGNYARLAGVAVQGRQNRQRNEMSLPAWNFAYTSSRNTRV